MRKEPPPISELVRGIQTDSGGGGRCGHIDNGAGGAMTMSLGSLASASNDIVIILKLFVIVDETNRGDAKARFALPLG